jgi:hypothetical protein
LIGEGEGDAVLSPTFVYASVFEMCDRAHGWEPSLCALEFDQKIASSVDEDGWAQSREYGD